jgi:glycosyltransferase involved in cell wall biosynthesis
MSRLRVLLFLTDFRIGGTERQVVNLVAGLQDSEFEAHVGCFRTEGQFLEELRERAATVAQFGIGPLWSPRSLASLRRLARYIRSRGIGLVHSYGLYPNLFALPAARMAGVRCVASIRDLGDHLPAWRRRLQRWACSLADRVVANASAVRAALIRDGYDAGRLDVIHNGIALERFRPRPGCVSPREELGIPRDAPLVAMLARLTELKGAEYFLEAAAIVAREQREARFLVVGDSKCLGMGNPAYRPALEDLAARLGLQGRVVFTGFRTDIPELLSELTVAVQPSLSEGLSNVVLESMAAGAPVVATAVGGNAEMVRDGETGLLVPPRDAPALAAGIGRLLAEPNLARRLGAAGRQRVEQCFSLEAMLRHTTALYREVLEMPSVQEAARLPLTQPEV